MTDHLERALQERLLARSQVSPRDVEALRLFARTLPARRSFWRRPAMQWALSAAAVVLAAVIALPLLFRAPGFGSESPAPSTPTPTQPAPTVTVTPSPPAPTADANRVRLRTASLSDVEVVIKDPADVVSGADPEQADATMSVRWFESIVEDAGENAIRVTWVGFPRDEVVQLEVRRSESGQLLLHFIQDGPPLNSDGEGEDRVVILYLTQPIDPSDVVVSFSDPVSFD